MSDTAGPTDIASLPPMPPPPIPHAVAVPRPRQRVRSLTPSALAWLGVAVIAGDLGLRSGLAALSSTVAIAIVAGPILGSLTCGAIERGGPRTAMFTVLTGLRIWPPMRADTWLTSLNAAAVVACLVVATLFTVNVVNPEARVAEHNLARADAVERLDADYLTRLSADAWPALLQHELLMTGRLHSVATLRDQCDLADAANSYGLAGFNLARQRLECG